MHDGCDRALEARWDIPLFLDAHLIEDHDSTALMFHISMGSRWRLTFLTHFVEIVAGYKGNSFQPVLEETLFLTVFELDHFPRFLYVFCQLIIKKRNIGEKLEKMQIKIMFRYRLKPNLGLGCIYLYWYIKYVYVYLYIYIHVLGYYSWSKY